MNFNHLLKVDVANPVNVARMKGSSLVRGTAAQKPRSFLAAAGIEQNIFSGKFNVHYRSFRLPSSAQSSCQHSDAR
jgi:hypothetical protein